MLKKSAFTFLLFFCIISFSQKNKNTVGFIENKGQIIDQNNKENKSVLYLLNANGLNVQLRKNGFSYDVYEFKSATKKQNKKDKFKFSKSEYQSEIKQKIKLHRVDIDFLNSNSNAKLVSEEKSVDYDNYYNVAHASNGITNVHKYQKVTYQNIYNKIDVVFFIPNDSTKVVEYNFIVKPGGKISDIQMEFKGAKTELRKNSIKITSRFGDMLETLPMSWIEEEKEKKQVSIQYKKIKNNVYGLESSEDVTGKKVIIDPVPVRLWGTYYGGFGYETAYNITIDNDNNLYITGSTLSTTNIATSGTYQYTADTANGFLTKFNTNGVRIWGTYYPSVLHDVKVDNNLNVYTSGFTSVAHMNITTVGSHQPLKNGSNDAYLIKLNSSGIREWATYYGGENSEINQNMTLDNQNNVYLCGITTSNENIATPNAHQPVRGSNNSDYDGYIVKFNENGVRQWATYYGGDQFDGVYGFCFYNDNLFFVGFSNSTNSISTPNSYQENKMSDVDSFIVKFDLNGNRVWGTYIGGENDDKFGYLAVIKNNYLYLVGATLSQTNIGTPNGLYESPQLILNEPEKQYAIIKFDIVNQQKIWGTYFISNISDLSVNNQNEIYFAGRTYLDDDIATSDGFLPIKNNNTSSYLIKLSPDCQKIWGTYYQGNSETRNPRIVIDNEKNIFMYGNSLGNTAGMSTPGAHQTSPNSNSDTYLVKFKDCFSVASASSNSPVCLSNTLNLTASGGTNYTWTGPNGFTSNLPNPTISNVNSIHNGQYDCYINGANGCDINISVFVEIQNIPAPIGNVNQIFCTKSNATLSEINITGTNIKWYSSISSTIPLSDTTLLINNTTYYATQTINGCESLNRLPITIVLTNTLSTSVYTEIISSDWTSNTITILLFNNSQGDYEYSLNGTDFQDSNTFNNLDTGEYTVYVRDKNGCGMVSEKVYLLTYPKFFTPNGDGFNDYWKIKFSENEPNLTVKLFDRYGKFLKQFGTNSIGWDGKYLGKDMPSTDYWFVVTRANGKEYKGHFSLKR